FTFTGSQYISQDFNFTLQLVSERNDITFDQLGGKNVTVSVSSSGGGERFFNGIISEFVFMETSEKDGLNKYRAVMVPALWVLRECIDCRVFQDKTVPDILKELLGKGALSAKGVVQTIDFRMELSGAYQPKELCVQYNESDLNFINRLCESEGIFYFFEHANRKHTLVFADDAQKHKPIAAGHGAAMRFQGALGANMDQECIQTLQVNNRLATGKYSARDYNFLKPNNDTTVQKSTSAVKPKSEGEIYEYPGGYATSDGEGANLAKIRMEASDAQTCNLQGRSNCRAFAAGFKFTLKEYPIPALNGKEYLLTKVRHDAKQEVATGASAGDTYFNIFFGMPHAMPFRPQRRTAKPVIVSSQTAIVTGPKAEEIHTDKYGRVKVKFHWDRRDNGKRDGDMSCWIRVSQSWAGAKWGGLNIPRVGHEVVVNFLDGDPDRPLVTGRVYHGLNLPPYDLPAEKTKSTIKSNSTKDGGGNYNEIRFEDLKGSEEVFTQAAKDQNEVVENDISTEVKRHQVIKVEQNRSITVASGNETVAIQSGTREVSVQSNEKHINAANFDQKVSANYTLKVNGNITIDASGLVTITGAKIILNG
ncbi:MAG: type VI secretion system tip protein VgrG, partial [Desulfobacterales bacterium]|nr:type VI secretion system tip protein VgrG [Desulfobacterales bacterium]